MTSKQLLAALMVAGSVGAGSGAAVTLALQTTSKGQYQVHAVDVRPRGPRPTDGGVIPVSVTAYASKALPDGGRKDIGQQPCAVGGAKQTDYEVLGAALMVVTESCVREE